MSAAETFSVSFEGGLAKAVRQAAAKEGLSVSSWLAEAAAAKARQRHLRDALDAAAAEHGPLSDDEVDRLIAKAREGSRISGSRSTKQPATARPRTRKSP